MNADRVNELYLGQLFSPETQRACRERINWIASQAVGKSVLDIGCSQGIVCLILGREGFTCTGVDIENDSLEYARRELAKEGEIVQKRVTFRLADASELPFPDHSYDTVIIGEVIEHLSNPERVLREANRVLKNNGRIVITTPYGLNPHHDHKQTFYPLSFLELVQPIFKTTFLDTQNNYLIYTGTNDPAYELAKVPRQDLLTEYTRFLKKVEERCFEKETALFETSTKLYDQIRVQGEQVTNLKKLLDEQKQAFALKEKDITFSRDSAVRELSLKEKEFRVLLDQSDKHHKEIITTIEKDYRNQQAAQEKDHRSNLTALENNHREGLHQKDKELAAQRESLTNKLLEQERLYSESLRTKETEYNRALKNLTGEIQKLRVDFEKKENELHVLITKAEIELKQVRELGIRKEKEHADALKLQHKKYNDELETKERIHKQALARKDADLINSMAQRENELFTNRRWLVGMLIVNPLELLIDFIKHPLQTAKRSVYHLRRGEFPKSLGALTIKSKRIILPASEQHIEVIKERSSIPVSGKSGEKRINVAAILDEFSTACFAPECNLITFRPDNWKEVVEETKPEMLLVESTWRGNDGSWQYKVASYQKPMGEELVDLIDYCKSKKIPTVFWNKEDPSNYDRFIHRAPLFDYVFTTDAECIPKYRQRVGHDRVFALPFAAQPSIHNPIVEKSREHNVAFAGAYYNVSFDERKKDMDLILKPALDFGLHIYDRQQGVTGPLAEQFRFPDIYQSAIKGRLEYDEMVKAYKRYKLFLNVNSVQTSPTMFSRRVFELLACGTPVISAYARGIDEMLGSEIVLLSKSEEETRAHLERILKNDDEWIRLSIKGMRKVLESHTYGHRLDEVLNTIGLSPESNRLPGITVIVRPEVSDHLKLIAGILKSQTYKKINVLLFPSKQIKKQDIDLFVNTLDGIPVNSLHQNSNVYEVCSREIKNGYIWLMNWKDYYGPSFLKDAVLAAAYSNADIVGKHTHFELAPNGSTIELKGTGHEFMHVESVVPGSALVRCDSLTNEEMNTLLGNRTLTIAKKRAISIDRFNFLRNAFANRETSLNNIDRVATKIII